MKLKDIRSANNEQLVEAVKDVIKNQTKLTLGEIHAITRVIMQRASEIGVSVETLNKIARGEK